MGRVRSRVENIASIGLCHGINPYAPILISVNFLFVISTLSQSEKS